MANHNSAKKAFRQTVKKTLINKSRLSRIKTFVKKFLLAAKAGPSEETTKLFVTVQSEVMRGVTKGVFKLNTASRIVSRLAGKLKA